MPGLRVTPEQLHVLSSTVGRTATDVRGAHQTLRNQLTPLFGSDWSGAASSQFHALYDDFDKHAQGLALSLEGIGRLLSQAGTAYADVEQQIAASFR